MLRSPTKTPSWASSQPRPIRPNQIWTTSVARPFQDEKRWTLSTGRSTWTHKRSERAFMTRTTLENRSRTIGFSARQRVEKGTAKELGRRRFLLIRTSLGKKRSEDRMGRGAQRDARQGLRRGRTTARTFISSPTCCEVNQSRFNITRDSVNLRYGDQFYNSYCKSACKVLVRDTFLRRFYRRFIM